MKLGNLTIYTLKFLKYKFKNYVSSRKRLIRMIFWYLGRQKLQSHNLDSGMRLIPDADERTQGNRYNQDPRYCSSSRTVMVTFLTRTSQLARPKLRDVNCRQGQINFPLPHEK